MLLLAPFGRSAATNSDDLISPVLAHVSLSKDDGDGNENGKKATGSDCKTTNLHKFAFLCRRCTTTT